MIHLLENVNYQIETEKLIHLGPPVRRGHQPTEATEPEGRIAETPRAGRGSFLHPVCPGVLLCAWHWRCCQE